MPTAAHASMQNLLAEEDFVRALARHLMGEDGADDLVQDTWLTAMRARAEARDPRSWLATVLRRLASNRRRGDTRRKRRERQASAAPIPAAPSTEAILACEEVRRRVVAAVLALDEPFQRTVVARYYEGLDSAQIAARDGIEVATVRSRLKRGLDRLRHRLDDEHNGNREAWAGPLALLGRGDSAPPVADAAGSVAPPLKLAVVAVAVVVMTLAIWALVPPAPPDASTNSTTVAAAPAAGGVDEALPQSTARRETVASTGPARSELRAALPFPVSDMPLTTVAVRVLDASTRQPVAGAVVRYLPFAIDRFDPRALRDFRVDERCLDLSTLTRQFGERTMSDEHGLATVRVPRFVGLVQAEIDDRWAERFVWPARGRVERVCELVLERDHSMVVRIVDAISGAPVSGKMVSVTGQGLTETLASFCGDLGPSDEDGIIRHSVPRDFSQLRVRPYTIGQSDYVVVDLAEARLRVPEIRYPTTGSLVVELRTPSGSLWPTLIKAKIAPLGAPCFGSDLYRPAEVANSEPGIYRVPRIETGKSYGVTVRPADGDAIGFGVALSADIVGPMQADEEVRVTLTSGFEPCILAASLQLADGSTPPPGLRAEVTGEQWIDGAWRATSDSAWTRCDESGRITWAVPTNCRVRGSIRLYERSGTESGSPDFRCNWEAPAGLPAGPHDLGRLVLEPARVVLAGTVEVGSRPWQSPPVVVGVEALLADGTWQDLQGCPVFPADSTSFEVRAFTDAAHLRVGLVQKQYYLPMPPIVVETGKTDLRLVVERGFELRARVLAPLAYAKAMRCRVVRADGADLPKADGGDSRDDAQLVDFDGEATQFAWPALPAGTYRVEVLAPGIEVPLAILTGIRVGEGPADPRLQSIDVRERTRTLTVTLDPARAAPRPVTDARVVVSEVRDGKAARHGMMFDEQGTARLMVGPDPVDLVVAVPGCRLLRVASFPGSVFHVEPEASIQVPFRLAPHVAERFAGHRVEVLLEPRGGSDRGADWAGRLTFVRPGPGDTLLMDAYELSGSLGGSKGGLADASLSPGRIRVPVADVGTFALWLEVGGRRLNYRDLLGPRANVTPATVVVTGDEMVEVVIDVAEEAIARMLEDLAREK